MEVNTAGTGSQRADDVFSVSSTMTHRTDIPFTDVGDDGWLVDTPTVASTSGPGGSGVGGSGGSGSATGGKEESLKTGDQELDDLLGM